MRTTVPCYMRDVGGTEREQGAQLTAPPRQSDYRPQLDTRLCAASS
jgi:hypothetical protein